MIPVNEDAARASVPLLLAAGLDAAFVAGDIVRVVDGRGVAVDLHVHRVDGVVEAVWRVLTRIKPPPCAE